jgi:hypothetical protein
MPKPKRRINENIPYLVDPEDLREIGVYPDLYLGSFGPFRSAA